MANDGDDLFRLRRTTGHGVINAHSFMHGQHARQEGRQCQFPVGYMADRLRNQPRRVFDAGRIQKDRVQQVLQTVLIGQSGNAPRSGASAESDEHLRLPAQQLCHFPVFFGTQRTVEQGQENIAIRQRLDVLCLGIEQTRTKHEVEVMINFQQDLINIGQGDFTSAAGSCPIHRKFWFAG